MNRVFEEGVVPFELIQQALAMLGALLLVLFHYHPRYRARRTPPFALAPWAVSPTHMALAVVCVMGGGALATQAVGQLSNATLGAAATDGERWQLLLGTAFQGGMLAGALLARVVWLRHDPLWLVAVPPFPLAVNPTGPTRRPLLAGGAVFLMGLSLVGVTGLLWKAILDAVGGDSSVQDMTMLVQNNDDPGKFLWVLVLAVVVAPVTEEVIFRAGLFRYLRGVVPSWVAALVSAIIFAALHGNLLAFPPLVVLGVVFALAYERSGRLSVTICAHALFNLNTLLMLILQSEG